jgi:hypothetical protein
MIAMPIASLLISPMELTMLCPLLVILVLLVDTNGFAAKSDISRRDSLQRIIALTSTGLALPQSPSNAVGNPQAVPTVQLGKGSLAVSRTIQGYWQLAGGHGRYREADAIANSKSSIFWLGSPY